MTPEEPRRMSDAETCAECGVPVRLVHRYPKGRPPERSHAVAAARTAASEKEPKPDGWHTYHICGGLLRELTWNGPDAMCVVCGQWFRAVVTPDARTAASGEGTLREALDGLWNAYSAYAGAAEGAGSFQSRAVQRLVEAAYEVIVADKGHPGRLGRAALAATPDSGAIDAGRLAALEEFLAASDASQPTPGSDEKP